MTGSGSIYVVAWVTDGIGPEVDYFYTPKEALECLNNIVDKGALPIETDDPMDFEEWYNEWVRVDNDNDCHTSINVTRIKV